MGKGIIPSSKSSNKRPPPDAPPRRGLVAEVRGAIRRGVYDGTAVLGKAVGRMLDEELGPE